jgi:hypothetical protein
VTFGDRAGVAELVGDLADVEAGFVEQGADSLAPDVAGNPIEADRIEGLADACGGEESSTMTSCGQPFR